MLSKIRQYSFLFTELVKRDFKKKYKRTILGMLWSMLYPLMMLFVMSLVFTQFFGRNTPHYIIYLFCGNLVFSYFKESTSTGMSSLVANASIIAKVNIPKYLFLLSKNVSSFINFGLTLIVFFIFVAIDKVSFSWKFMMLIYPIICLFLFNIGMGLILSALFVVFKDISYFYDIFTMIVMYGSAIFYTVNTYSLQIQQLFYLNPIYVFISYFRKIVLENVVPSVGLHLLCLGYALIVLIIGAFIYKKKNYKFIYYL